MMHAAIKALLIEDDPVFVMLIGKVLAEGGGLSVDLQCASRLAEGLERLARDKADVLLLDLNLPDSSGLDTLSRVQAVAGAVPIVVLTAIDNDELAAQAVREGAQDYLVKRDLDGRMLGRMLLYAIERKKAEEALRRAEEKYRNIFENAVEGIAQSLPDGRILAANAALARIFGYDSPEDLLASVQDLGKQVYADPADREKMLGLLQRQRTLEGYEYQFRRKDGSLGWDSLGIRAVRDKDGNLLYYQSTHEDITARKRAEAEKASLEEQLRQAQKMEAIGQLAGGVAHDFNNMLFIINGRAEMVLNGLKPGDPLRSPLELIYKTGQRAANLTRQLLAFGRRQVLQPKVLDLNAVIADVEKMLRRLVREDIAFSTFLDPNLKTTKADPGQLTQVLMNLVVNAQDAMPKGGKLTIETHNAELDESYCRRRRYATPGRYVLLAVSDTGCGMDDYVKAHIFEPFFTTKGQGRGTGLGLATVYGIVKQSGGNIEVYSELCKGTTFKVYLPQAGDLPVRASRQVQTVSRRGEETILLVEDEAEVLSLARDILVASGYTVLPAGNGAEALQVCEQHKGVIHLALCDVIMPKMSGPELARLLASRFPGIKILFMSGYADHAIADQGGLCSDVQFIQKPVTPADLTCKVREVLDGE